MWTETSKNNLNSQLNKVEESTSEINEVTVITKECVSYSLENANSNQSKKPTECIESKNSFTRIYLVRHLPYKECKEYSLYEDIRDKLKENLQSDEIHKYLEEKYWNFYTSLIKNFEQEENPIAFLFGVLDDTLCTDSSNLNSNLYDSIFKDQKNTILIHNPIDSSKERIKQSVEYIKSKYPDIIFQEENIVWSQKWIDKQLAVIKAWEELVEIIVDIKSKIKQENSSLKWKTIVILWSRSHSHFLNVKKFDANWKDKSEGEFEEKWYDFIDLGNNLDIIDDTSKLIINPGNYKDLKKIFPDRDNGSITDFQDKVNAYFIENRKLYEEYLLSENSDLRFFCIANLIKKWEFDVVLENITKLFNLEKEEDIIWFGNNLLWLCDKKEKKDIFKSLEWETDIITKLNLGNLEYQINYNEFVKKNNIKYLREKTQDENIKNWKAMSISVWFNEKQYNNIENLLTSDKVLLIEASAGSGKSIKLLEIMEYLSPKKDMAEYKYFPIYIHLWKYKKIEEIKERMWALKRGIYGTWKYTFVYLFDAIDEAWMDDDDKKEFLKMTEELQKKWKVIITSRHEHLVGTDKKKIELKPLTKEQIEQYIQEYIAWNQEWEYIWKKWQENWFIEEIKDNPLMLSMLVELIKNTDKIKKLKDYWFIENLNIQKKSDLFDIIVTLRLYEWEIKKTDYWEERTENEIKSIINNRKKILELIAIESVEKNDFITKKEIDIIINDNKLDWWMLGKNRFLENLNLIFKYNSETDQYQFVHEKFREYFLYISYKKKTKWKNINIADILLEHFNNLTTEKQVAIFNSYKEFEYRLDMTLEDIFVEYFNNLTTEKLVAIWFNSFEEFEYNINIILDIYWDKKWDVFYKVFLAISKYKTKESLNILEKYYRKIYRKKKGDIDLWKIQVFCEIIGEIWLEEWLEILELFTEIVWLFKERNMVENYCETIVKINSEKWLDLINKIINKNPEIMTKRNIQLIIWTIGELKLEKWYKILEKIIETYWIPDIENIQFTLLLSLKKIMEKNWINNLPEILRESLVLIIWWIMNQQ